MFFENLENVFMKIKGEAKMNAKIYRSDRGFIELVKNVVSVEPFGKPDKTGLRVNCENKADSRCYSNRLDEKAYFSVDFINDEF